MDNVDYLILVNFIKYMKKFKNGLIFKTHNK